MQALLKEKHKLFIKGNAADNLIRQYEKDGIIPSFKNNKYDQARRKDLVEVVRSLYCVEPKIFKGLNKDQQKINIGLINLLLDTDERENLIEVLGHIIKMTSEERQELSNVLKKTTISKISRTISLIENRFKVIELLKLLVYDLKKFTKEVSHIQKVMEENYWLIGEQYHLVSANENFKTLKDKYTQVVTKEENQRGEKTTDPDINRRPDIFICRKRSVPDLQDDQLDLEENIIIELKRPTIKIGKDQLRQIEDYLDIIIRDDQFNSQKRIWKFYAISNSVDEHTKLQYDFAKDKGKRFLVKAVSNYEIYALTWDDVFTSFNLRHKFLVDKLELDKEIIIQELREKGIIFSTDGATSITTQIINLGSA